MLGDKRGERVNEMPFVHFEYKSIERKRKKKKGKEKEEKEKKKRKKRKVGECG